MLKQEQILDFQVPDVCIFELIHATKLTFMIRIFRQTESSNCSTSQGIRCSLFYSNCSTSQSF